MVNSITILNERDLDRVNGGMQAQMQAGMMREFFVITSVAVFGIAIGMAIYPWLVNFVCKDHINDDLEMCKRNKRRKQQ